MENHKRLRMIRESQDFRDIFDRHYAGIFKRLAYLTGDTDTADDLAQEVFIKLLRTPPKEHANIAGWLYKVAHNTAYNYLRSEKHRRERDTKSNSLRLDSQGSAEDNAMDIIEAAEVRAALDQLDSKDRVGLLLKAAGYSYEEIADAINVKGSSVGSLLARAQAKFVKILRSHASGGVQDVLQTQRTSGLS